MGLGSAQPLGEMSTWDISWGQRHPVCRVDNLDMNPVQASTEIALPMARDLTGISTYPITVILIKTALINR